MFKHQLFLKGLLIFRALTFKREWRSTYTTGTLTWYNVCPCKGAFKQNIMAALKRTLNVTEVIFFATGVILGAGIYAIVGKAAGFSGPMLWLSFLIASIT